MENAKIEDYSKDELLALKTLVQNGVSYSLIAKILKRSVRSLSVKASRLGFTNHNKHKNLNDNQILIDYSKLDSKIKGTIAEYKVAIKLAELGFKVYFPFINNQEEDLIIQKKNKYFRIQIKSATKTNDDRFRTSIVRKRTIGKNKGKRIRYDNIDFFIIYIPIFELFYVIPDGKTKTVNELNFYPHKIKTMVKPNIFDWDFYKNKFNLIN